jgi:hypothetical protein
MAAGAVFVISAAMRGLGDCALAKLAAMVQATNIPQSRSQFCWSDANFVIIRVL